MNILVSALVDHLAVMPIYFYIIYFFLDGKPVSLLPLTTSTLILLTSPLNCIHIQVGIRTSCPSVFSRRIRRHRRVDAWMLTRPKMLEFNLRITPRLFPRSAYKWTCVIVSGCWIPAWPTFWAIQSRLRPIRFWSSI